MRPYLRHLATAGILILVVAMGVAGAAAALGRSLATPPPPPPGTLRIYRAAQPRPPWIIQVTGEKLTGRVAPAPLGIPCAPPPAGGPYTPIPAGVPPPHPDGAAYARYPNASWPTAARYISPAPAPADVVAIAVLADLRYDVAGREIHVITCAPSAAMALQELILGNGEVDLGGGRLGFLPNSGGTPPPRSVRFAEGPLVIEVTSDDPAADVVGIARDVVIGK